MTNLLDLPAELLQHIAGYLSYRTYCNVIVANKALREVCTDRAVLLHVVSSGHHNAVGACECILFKHSQQGRIALADAQLDWPQGDRILKNASFEQLRKTAYAIEVCMEYSYTRSKDQLSWMNSTDNMSFIGWLPQMLALQHPITLGLELNQFLGILHDPKKLVVVGHDEGPTENAFTTFWDQAVSLVRSLYRVTESDFVQMSFIMNYLTLQRYASTLDKKVIAWMFDDHFSPGEVRTSPNRQDMRPLAGTLKQMFQRVPNYGVYGPEFAAKEASAVLLPLMVGLIVQFSDADSDGDLPKPSKICMYEFMDIPDVNLDGLASEFTTCHLDKTTAPAFLDGDWLGYYTDERGFNVGREKHEYFDARMSQIKICAREPGIHDPESDQISALIDSHSGGRDGHGQFNLEGHVLRDGRVRLTKHYTAAGWEWDWRGYVTPFGVVGTWGCDGYFGGYLWIWREEWI